ncbi:MAG: hypothetical protein K1X68_02190 [Saprospiraceae bacterium]|nr:hypothetical protein [Saprospiraceae bacterium]HMW40222.1 hypothetical protein [Saprospiraceae bacterium]HMX89102.1 hypothetical protein [Saprospiraceae bacterium]HMZ40973.1 hypothetical protein [Saprospiraceae bacterium]HNA65979.1 hypothetical protein [Saprospiraceae bacterium]
MKNKRISSKLAGLSVIALMLLTSCNRGYGCPYDFSVAETLVQWSKVLIQVISLIF